MSTFGYVITLVVLITILQCQVQADSDIYLLGHNTRVWLAEQDSKRNMHYKPQPPETVKEAFDSVKKDLGGVMHILGSAKEIKTLSILVLVETKNDPCPHEPAARKKYIHRHILRIAAFWNEVNVVLNQAIQDPIVQIRIAGIVIPDNEDAGYSYAFSKNVHRFLKPFGSELLKAYDTLNDQLFGWSAATNNFFNANNFNVIATMYHLDSAGLFNYSWSMRFNNCEGKNRRPPACGLIFYNDSYGVSRAVGEVAHLLGREYSGNTAKVYQASDISADDVAAIRRNLKSMSCWDKPNENWKPGKPLPPIFFKDL
uniref:Venom protein 3 n=1 Tax=Pimpla hypochondriaca TaxID=135724 RepID=Q8MMH2_PIMHY|nr:venom protein 3 [Pimpla hypochondriaca]